MKDRETFFSSAQRSQIVWQILMRTSYDDDEDDKVGIRYHKRIICLKTVELFIEKYWLFFFGFWEIQVEKLLVKDRLLPCPQVIILLFFLLLDVY